MKTKYLPSGVQGLLLTACERSLAVRARSVRRGGSVLYHGTRYAQAILSSNAIRCSSPGTPAVSLTRLPEVAAFAAGLERDDTDGPPSILILDRRSLQARYRLRPYHDGWPGHSGAARDEAEELVFDRDVTDVHRHIIGVVS